MPRRILPNIRSKGAKPARRSRAASNRSPKLMAAPSGIRRICFVTGSRAEFGLMKTTLQAIKKHPSLKLQLIVTGMHLDRAHGDGLGAIRETGWAVDAVVPWLDELPTQGHGHGLAGATGAAMGFLSAEFARLKPDIVLIVGDRVEAFAAAAAGHLSGHVVAHVHGGDRAMGQVDDTLRHAITKLSHLHFPATAKSASRIKKLGEDAWRIHATGSPGADGIMAMALPPENLYRRFGKLSPRRFALLVLHPTEADNRIEQSRARLLLRELLRTPLEHVVVVYPNNDPGCEGIIQCWESARGARVLRYPDLSRDKFLGLMRDAAVLVGNSSSGIIEAENFGTPVIDVGPRQAGRERAKNVTSVAWNRAEIAKALKRIGPGARTSARRGGGVYGGDGAGRRIAEILAQVPINPRLLRKLIVY